LARSQASKTKALWSGAVTVAILAIVLIVFASISPLTSKKKPSTSGQPVASQPVDESTALYMQAVAAQKSGDLTRTAELARSAVQADPNNAEAAKLLETVTKQQAAASKPDASTPSTGATGTPKPSPATDPVFLKVYKPLSVLLPTAAAGYSLGAPTELKGDVTMSGRPTSPNLPIYAVIWSAHDRKTAAKAKEFVTKTSKVAFPEDSASVTIDGVPGYFGTDGTKFATVSFARGRYAFELLVTSSPGYKPIDTKAAALAVARSFPDSPAQ